MQAMWMWVGLAAAVTAGIGVWAYRRFVRASSGRDDRYAPEPVVTPEQVALLDYLRDTFPDQVVLPRMSLAHMLSVRRAQDPRRALERLSAHQVDFVVCGQDGRPRFAFDIERFHLSDAKAKALQTKIKNRMLRTAGVRFLMLKDGIHRMPTPAEFRQQLNLAALPQPPADRDRGDELRQQLESKFSQFDQLYQSTGFRDSEIMGMSGLMDLDEGDEGGAERLARQRPSVVRGNSRSR